MNAVYAMAWKLHCCISHSRQNAAFSSSSLRGSLMLPQAENRLEMHCAARSARRQGQNQHCTQVKKKQINQFMANAAEAYATDAIERRCTSKAWRNDGDKHNKHSSRIWRLGNDAVNQKCASNEHFCAKCASRAFLYDGAPKNMFVCVIPIKL